MAYTFTINVITIQSNPDERVEYAFENGGWSHSITTTEDVDGCREVSTSTSACSAEDVITALLLSMSQKGVEVFVKKRRGTAVSVQGWRQGFSRQIGDTPHTWFGEGSDLKIE